MSRSARRWRERAIHRARVRRLPAIRAATIIGRGGGPAARKLQMTFQLLRGPIVASGALTHSDFDELHETLDDPTFYFIHHTNFGAWGRRAGSPVGRSSRGLPTGTTRRA